MASQYIIKQGDYLPKIAQENGFYDYLTIWDHGKNAQLKSKRKNPNVLAPGDELHIPDKTPMWIRPPVNATAASSSRAVSRAVYVGSCLRAPGTATGRPTSRRKSFAFTWSLSTRRPHLLSFDVLRASARMAHPSQDGAGKRVCG